MTRKQAFVVIFRVKSSTVVTIRGMKATEEGKPASVKVSFKVKKTGKASKYSYVSKVNVIEDKYTLTAAATAVKEITLTFNKAVKDTTAAKVVVKKGNTTPTFTATWAADAKSVVLAMDSKLTKGTYDVTVSGVEKEDLTASIDVEDQKLTAFELISTNLVANPTVSTKASIQYRAVDQYGKNVAGVNPTVTTSFGGTATAASTKSSENSKIDVSGISTALAIVGTKGTVTIVDNSTGINLTSEVTYVASAKASKVEVVGVYNTNTNKLVETMTAGDNASNYAVALKFTDQYDVEMAWNDSTFAGDIEISLAAGTTGVGKSAASSVVIDDKTYYAVPLSNTLSAGTFQLTVVNKKIGLLGNLSFDVAPGTVIKSFSVSADSDIYAGESATLSYVAVDAEGKEVTSFDVLKKAFGGTTPTTNVTLSKQTDGSGKLTYKQAADVTNTDSTNHRGSDSKVLTFQLYSGTANIIVVNTSIRVNEKRYIWEVTGVNADKAVAGVSGTALSFKAEDLKIADQYGNTLSKDNINDLVANGGIKVSNTENPSNFTLKGVSAGNSAVISTKTATFGAIVASGGSVKLNIKSNTNTNDAGYDLTLSQANAEKASTFEIKWNDSVNTFCTTKAAITASTIKSKFTVVGKVGGKTVTIPSDNYEVTGLTGGDKLGEINSATNTVEKTIEGTVTVTVRTTDDNGKSVATDVSATFTNSNADPKLASIKANNDATVSYNSGTLQVANLASGFTLKDQYGNAIGSDGVVATVVILDSSNGDVEYNGTTACKVTGVQQNDKISITLKKGDLTANREVTLGA